MENIEEIYSIILKTKFEYFMSEVIRDINVIDFAIISFDVKYKNSVYNNMVKKYIYDLDRVGFSKAMQIIENEMFLYNLSEEALMRNNLCMLRRWIIRCSGYMCLKKLAEETVSEGIDQYMKRFSINEEISDINTLNSKIESIDSDILVNLKSSIY